MDGINQPTDNPMQSLTGPQFFSSPQQPSIPGSFIGPSVSAQESLPSAPVEPLLPPPSISPAVEPESSPAQPQASERISYSDARIEEVDISLISPNPFQPRKVFEQVGLQELADSIKEHGVIQPLVVSKTATGYELVVGERRFRASQLAGLQKVPAIIKRELEDQTKLEVALIENIQRRELNPIEEAQAYDRLMKTFNLTQEQVAKKVGKSRPAIANTVRLLNLPAEIQRAVVEGKISEGHARAILGLPDTEKQLLMYKMVLEQGLNVRQVEAKVREVTVKRQMDAAAPDPKLMALETELRGKLGTQVKIQRQGRGGKITIEFFSDDELNDIIHKMATEQQGPSSSYLTV
jgi:ParB family chromosome partitioning protein